MCRNFSLQHFGCPACFSLMLQSLSIFCVAFCVYVTHFCTSNNVSDLLHVYCVTSFTVYVSITILQNVLLSSEHAQEDDTSSPNVNCRCWLRRLTQHFGCSESSGSTSTSAAFHSQVRCRPKINQTIHTRDRMVHEVCRLDVTMRDVVRVQERQGLEQFTHVHNYISPCDCFQVFPKVIAPFHQLKLQTIVLIRLFQPMVANQVF